MDRRTNLLDDACWYPVAFVISYLLNDRVFIYVRSPTICWSSHRPSLHVHCSLSAVPRFVSYTGVRRTCYWSDRSNFLFAASEQTLQIHWYSGWYRCMTDHCVLFKVALVCRGGETRRMLADALN